MAGVFISYAREDVAKAKAIARVIEQDSLSVWMDERIRSGSEYSDEIEHALNQAEAVVVLWSANSVRSSWVRDEAEEGRDSGRLVPVLLDSSRPPMGFRQFQATDLSRWSGRGRPRQLDDLLAAVRERITGPRPPQSVAGPRARRPWSRYAVLAALLLAVASLGWWAWNRNRPAQQTPSVALLPFTADQSDAEARRLASATHDALAHTLSQGAYEVRVIGALPADGEQPADFVISGQLGSSGDRVQATVRMVEPRRNAVIFSHQFEVARAETAVLPERVGAQVAAQLSWTAPLVMVDRRRPTDPAITASLLQQVSDLDEGLGLLQGYELNRRLAARAPDSAIAQLGLAMSTGFALGEIPVADRAQAVAAARAAAIRVQKLAPDFGDVYIPWCLLHSEQRTAECEDRLRAGLRADPNAPFVHLFLAYLLNRVGRNIEAAELARASLAHDPYVPAKLALMIRMLEVTGEHERAGEMFRQATRWWPDRQEILWDRRVGLLQRGDLESLLPLDGMGGYSEPRIGRLSTAVTNRSLGGAKTACAGPIREGLLPYLCMLAYGQLGDLDEAYRLAFALYPNRRGRTPAEEERIWLNRPDAAPLAFLASPAAAPLRRDPRYLQLTERAGLLEYWRSGRAPDFCRTRSEPICARLSKRR